MNYGKLELSRLRLRQRLLDARQQKVYWRGELSSSALSTATAAIALHMADSGDPIAKAGMEAMERLQNPDGGFGDTDLSKSNLSTTALCWAAFLITGRNCAAKDRTIEWVRLAAGGLDRKLC
jgi:squalene-hopene/tetraprenyl-beta-curcumene cyclase